MLIWELLDVEPIEKHAHIEPTHATASWPSELRVSVIKKINNLYVNLGNNTAEK